MTETIDTYGKRVFEAIDAVEVPQEVIDDGIKTVKEMSGIDAGPETVKRGAKEFAALSYAIYSLKKFGKTPDQILSLIIPMLAMDADAVDEVVYGPSGKAH